ncbi:MAG: ABC transporter [Firmicutes bacterium GWF2_51_9]|nr:MAG: ABC transporter [Firmicutes bacterium GWF2_51_9]OGS59356.1 MAG: ABC transporter [Firmicutes bacterium GWE2_51_13]HBZ40314.1 ABC transporter [Erysipelotrichaceae bacterium]
MSKGMGPRGSRGFLSEEEKQNRPKITVGLLKRIFSYLLPYWKKLLLVVIAILVSSILGLLPSVLTGRIIDEGLIAGDFDALAWLVAASVIVLLASNLIGVLESYLNTSIAHFITYEMRNRMYAHLQKMSHRFFTSSKQGDIITRMTSDIGGVESVISGTLTSILRNVAILVTSVIVMYQKNWLLATIGILIIPLLALPTKRVGKTRWMIATQTQVKNDEINQILNETMNVSGQQLVKLFTNEAMEYAKYSDANQEMTRLKIKENMAGRWFRVAMSTYTGIGPLLLYFVGGLLMIRYGKTDLSVGDVTVMVALLSRMYQPVNQLLNIQVDLIRSLALFTRIFDYFDLPIEIQEKKDAISLSSFRGELAFSHVDFAYDPGQPILKGLTFDIPVGHSVAIVGSSGAGKSTLINLIVRLYDVGGGKITLDGIDLRDLSLSSLRRAIGVVTQDTYLFNGTIRENLLYAKSDAQEDELIDVCRQANIHDFIQGLPQGYDTIVGNRGIKLSGGEKQRVSIARVLLKDPALIILDEATSSLDSISESLIQDALDPLLKGRTSIIIAHRLSTIMAADTILVLDHGEIVESGKHGDLVENSVVYKELYETQFRRALEDVRSRQTPD